MTQGRLIYTNDEIRGATYKVAFAIKRSGFKPDYALIIMAGGMRFGSMLLERLHFFEIDVPMIFSIRVEDDFMMYTNEELKGRSVLIIDDMFDTGETIEEARTQLEVNFHVKEQRTAVLILREFEENTSISPPEYFGFSLKSNEWLYGFGLDLSGKQRGNPNIYGISQEERRILNADGGNRGRAL